MSKLETAESLYLLGHPIAHSKSPVMYNAVYARLGLPWCYELADLAGEEEARAFLAARDFLSVNITTPYKPHAFEAATHKAASAKLARGANLLVKHGEALLAYNTDGQGCVAFLERTGFDFAGASVAVCGTGPTALSILHAASLAGAGEIVLNSIDTDGVKRGFDLEMLEALSKRVSLPIIASGGAGKMEDFKTLFTLPGVDAGLAASIFHFGEVDIGNLKRYLTENGVPVRL